MTRYLTGNRVTPEDAIKYNNDVSDSRSKNFSSVGCVSSIYCENCGYQNADTICLCVGFSSGFECLNCKKNVKLNIINLKEIKYEPFSPNIPINYSNSIRNK